MSPPDQFYLSPDTVVVGCWWTGIRMDDLRREMHRCERLRLLIGGEPPPPA
jgi:hypothetical protein